MKQQFAAEERATIRMQGYRFAVRLFGWGWLVIFTLRLMMEYGSLAVHDSELFSDYSVFLELFGAPKLSPAAMGIYSGTILIALLISLCLRKDDCVIGIGDALLSLPVLYVQLPVVIRLSEQVDASCTVNLIWFALSAAIPLVVQILRTAGMVRKIFLKALDKRHYSCYNN